MSTSVPTPVSTAALLLKAADQASPLFLGLCLAAAFSVAVI